MVLATSFMAPRAASPVFFTSRSVWAADTNHASNCGGRNDDREGGDDDEEDGGDDQRFDRRRRMPEPGHGNQRAGRQGEPSVRPSVAIRSMKGLSHSEIVSFFGASRT